MPSRQHTAQALQIITAPGIMVPRFFISGMMTGGIPSCQPDRASTSHDVVVPQVVQVPAMLQIKHPHDDDAQNQQKQLRLTHAPLLPPQGVASWGDTSC